MKLVRIAVIVVAVLFLLLALALSLGPARLEGGMNTVIFHPAYDVSDEARALHKSLVIGDLHADSTLWQRDLLERSDRGHVDIPRMREGNVALGSDYDGSISAPFDTSELVVLTDEMLKANFTEAEIRKVMGENGFRKYKPPNRWISNLLVLASTGTESRCVAI